MRTTLTLDPDVARAIERLRTERGLGLKEIVNRSLRIGLAEIEAPRDRSAPYCTPSDSLGGALLPSVDDIAGVLALCEGEDFR